MKLIKKASGKTKIKMSKKEWTNIGKKAGWDELPGYDSWKTTPNNDRDNDPVTCPICDEKMDYDGEDWRCSDPKCSGIRSGFPDYE